MNEINFIDEKERELFARAALGQEVQDFLASNVGRYLHGRARVDVEQAQVDALACDPDSFWGRKKLKKLRQKADIAKNFMRYCADAIQDGEIAYTELKEHRGTDA